jgi:hypothetical protein
MTNLPGIMRLSVSKILVIAILSAGLINLSFYATAGSAATSPSSATNVIPATSASSTTPPYQDTTRRD